MTLARLASWLVLIARALTSARWTSILLILVLSGCASIYKPQNEKITRIHSGKGYRLMQTRQGDLGDHLIFLAFSGGGTRAAALSYGVLQELRDTRIDSRQSRVRLLDEVDSISAVSGGSFTAAYFGLFGDKIFTDYEKVFLRQSIQSALIRKLFDPEYWWHSVFSGFDRTEMAIEYYDNHIFERKTFADFLTHGGPYIEINATDLGGGTRFSFSQAYFDLLCSNLDRFSVARAVTASSAVPLAFPTVVLQNYSGSCNLNDSHWVQFLSRQNDSDPRLREMKERVKYYRNRKANPYIHLVDGGIADNLGLRALTDRIEAFNGGGPFEKGKPGPRSVLIISVDAEVDPERSINQSPSKPSVVDTVDAFSNVQISLYNDETRLLLASKLGHLKEQVRNDGHDVRFYNVNVSFQSLNSKSLKSYFNNLPTSLELSGRDVDNLIYAGRDLLRRDADFRRYLEDYGGTGLPELPDTPRPGVIEDR